MRLNADIEHVARAALALAGVPPDEHAKIIEALLLRLDRDAAEIRRDAAIREAYNLLIPGPSTMKILEGALRDFHTRRWPRVRHRADPPDDYSPIWRAYFRACQAAEDAGKKIPARRQMERIVFAS